jgi:DNA-binding transcriptional ArsR family regulator
MDLGSPLASLVGPIPAAILRVLARTHAEFTGRQLYRLAGVGSASSVSKALSRLSETGLVTSRPMPYATLYRLNRDHILWPAVELALSGVSELRMRIRRYAETHGPVGLTVALYGSVERGDAGETSDVDVLVVFRDDTPREARDEFVYDLSNSIQEWTGNSAQVIQMGSSELRESVGRGDALVEAWMTDSDVLIGSAIESKDGL